MFHLYRGAKVTIISLISKRKHKKREACPATYPPNAIIVIEKTLVVLYQTRVADAANLVLGIAIVRIPGVILILHVHDDAVGR